MSGSPLGQTHYRISNGAYEHHHHGFVDHHQHATAAPVKNRLASFRPALQAISAR